MKYKYRKKIIRELVDVNDCDLKFLFFLNFRNKDYI